MMIPGEKRKGEVLVTVDGAPLDWRSSLSVRNHLADGPGVGLRWFGAGAARAGDPAVGHRTQRRPNASTSGSSGASSRRVEADRWTLDASDVRRWLEAETDDVVRMALNEA